MFAMLIADNNRVVWVSEEAPTTGEVVYYTFGEVIRLGEGVRHEGKRNELELF